MTTAWRDGTFQSSPLWGAKSLQITQQYGPTSLTVEPLLGAVHFHCGIDVGMVVGTPLYAPRDGVVGYVGYALLAITAADRSGCDWYIHIDHVAPGVVVGAAVKRGQLVAYSGNKVPGGGASTGPHLHFELQNYPGALLGHYDVNGRWVQPYGSMNNPASSVDPVAVLSGASGQASQSQQEDAMLYVTPLVAKAASIKAFVAGSVYSDPSPNARVVAAVAKDSLVTVTGYLYSSAPVLSPDLSGAAGAQPGSDPVWWTVAGGYVADAILDTSKLAGAPSVAAPTSGWANYFALAGQMAPVDVAALTATVVKQLPPYATPDQVKKAIADAFGAAKLTLPV